ncbi:dipeptidase PepV [Cytobacillus gottheilii]|uniref:dipeptidase PepV n=1 Tax=Cytobacillus gottheilii TaxID=859144 RepID=UPI0009BAE3C6|nr:dipeptidase PepV [Cytobacillus gottheilii]
MNVLDWNKEVNNRKESLIKDAQALLQIKSVLDEENAKEDAPLGQGVKEALDFMLTLGEKDGFTAKNVGNLAGHLEFGEGDEIVGILCHVDVVPEGDGWSSDPFGAEIRDGKIFARGAIDDKGPTMAAYYAMKIVKELDLPLSKRVRMIIGTDEESNWRCVDHYFKHEEMPTLGFAPDADFPIIYAEKGISDFDIVQLKKEQKEVINVQAEVNSFHSGLRYNMVPDFAKASLLIHFEPTEIVQKYSDFLRDGDLEGKYYMDNGMLILELQGVSAHGLEPENGKNAGLLMANFLAGIQLDAESQHFITFTNQYFCGDSRGKKLGIAFEDHITGELTVNVGKLSYTKEDGGRLGLTVRYPVTNEMDHTKEKLDQLLEENHFTIENFSDSKPHHVAEDDFLIQTLKKVYQLQTGEEPELLSIGGGTYARSLKSGVAFGPLFPGREDIAHQKDEYMYIEDLVKATAIYAHAIFELAK